MHQLHTGSAPTVAPDLEYILRILIRIWVLRPKARQENTFAQSDFMCRGGDVDQEAIHLPIGCRLQYVYKRRRFVWPALSRNKYTHLGQEVMNADVASENMRFQLQP